MLEGILAVVLSRERIEHVKIAVHCESNNGRGERIVTNQSIRLFIAKPIERDVGLGQEPVF